MSSQEFDDNCPSCKPVINDLETGKPMGPATPIMQAVERVWKESSFEERKAFHSVTCRNSRKSEDIELFRSLAMRIKSVAEADCKLVYGR